MGVKARSRTLKTKNPSRQRKRMVWYVPAQQRRWFRQLTRHLSRLEKSAVGSNKTKCRHRRQQCKAQMSVLSQSKLASKPKSNIVLWEKGMTAQKTLTRSKFRELNEALQEAVEIKRQEAALKERDEINRAKLLELGESLIDETTATAAPGFQISTSTEVEYDEKAALAYCKRPDVFPAASTMLIVHKDSIGMLIGWAIRFKEALGELSTMPDSEEKQKLMGLFGSVNLSNIFDLNDAGYKAAVRGERFNDIPFISKTEKKTPKITAKSVKLGDELAKEFQIVEDPAPEVEATEPAAD